MGGEACVDEARAPPTGDAPSGLASRRVGEERVHDVPDAVPVDAEHRDLVILEPGTEVLGDVALVAPERRAEPPEHIVERDIVIVEGSSRLKIAV